MNLAPSALDLVTETKVECQVGTNLDVVLNKQLRTLLAGSGFRLVVRAPAFYLALEKVGVSEAAFDTRRSSLRVDAPKLNLPDCMLPHGVVLLS